MRTKILTIAFVCCLTSGISAQQYGWTDLFPNMPDTPTDTVYIGGEPYYGSYTDLFFINDDEGWVTSLQQNENQEFLIFHTQDGGQSWEIQKHWNYSHSIWMLDSLNGYLGDHSGFIMVTHDGGDTWNFHGACGGPVTDISFAPGSDTGYVTIDESYYLWQITPTGVNQIPINHLNYWSGISATDEAVWFCGGIQVFYLDPEQLLITPELVIHCGYFGPVFFADRDHGWIGNYCEIRGFVDYDNYWPKIFETDEEPITALYAIDTNQLWAVTAKGRILHTTNASDYGYIKETNYYWSNVVWDEQSHPRPDNWLSAIQFTSLHNGYSCGENNTILKYTIVNGISNPSAVSVKIFPNPTPGPCKIQCNELDLIGKLVEIRIKDLSGREIVSDSRLVNAGDISLDLTLLPPGIYLLQLSAEDQAVIQKLIRQ